MTKYINELGYELEGRALALWEGTATDKTEAECEAYRQMLRKRPKPGTTTMKPNANGHVAKLPTAKPPTAKPPCIHLGAPTGEMKLCKSCSGTVNLKLLV